MSVDSTPSLATGSKLGHYVIRRAVGAGGMGEVYEAEDTRLHRRIALKVVRHDVAADPIRRARLEREATAAATLNHPHVVTVHSLEEHAGVLFVTMELIEGSTLAEVLPPQGFPVERVLAIGMQLAEALGVAHAAGIVHRDLKPANVMVTRSGSVKVLDFGLSRVTMDEAAGTRTTIELTSDGALIGTAPYMSPEQIDGHVADARSDIFALGIVLFEMATGRRPFNGPTVMATLSAIAKDTPPLASAVNPAVPEELARIIDRCLVKDPARRVQSAVDLQAQLEDLEQILDSGRPSARLHRWRVPLAVTTVAATAIAGSLWALGRPALELLGERTSSTSPLTARDAVVIADFVNTTGESVFDDTLKHALAVQLEQSPFLGITADQQVRETLRFMNRSPDDRVEGEVAREVCQRIGAKALLAGSVQALGNRYVVNLSASNCQTGEVLALEQATADAKEEVLSAVGDAASRLRQRLGESLSSVQRYDVGITQVTTASLDALKAFSLGERQRMKGSDREAIPFYRRAIELDPDFALAYHRIALMHRASGESWLDAQYATEAFKRRHRVSERERLAIEARYYFSVTGELHRVLETHRVLAATYTRDWSAANNVGVNLGQMGQHREALDAQLEALARAPDNPLVRSNVAWTLLRLNRLDDAQRRFQEVVTAGGRAADARRGLYLIAFLRNDRIAMEQHRDAARGPMMTLSEARAAASRGAWREARTLYRLAAESTAATPEIAAQIASEQALVAAFVGHHAEAAQQARSAAAMSRNPHAIWSAAAAMALSAEPAEAQRLIDDLAREYPLHTLIQYSGLPSARAAIELRAGRGGQALAHLTPAAPYELGERPWIGPNCLTIYLKGLAYLASTAWPEAIAEFQKIVDHPGLNAASPLFSLAQLGLGRAYAGASDSERARQQFDTVLTIWRNGDPDVPILRAAKHEAAALNAGSR